MSPRSVDLLNIGLMLAALGAAFALPFELFLFSYAVLGPLHYLTEIAWLKERNFFTHGKGDWIPIAGLAVLVLLGQPFVIGSWSVGLLNQYAPQLIATAFGLALVFTLFKTQLERLLAALAVLAVITFFSGVGARGWFLFALYVPTLVHVCLFTLAFMLFGALKGRSPTGYAACALLVACALVAILAPAQASEGVSAYVRASYQSFSSMNFEFANLLGFGHAPGQPFRSFGELFTTPWGIAVQRFIAFAYTYHYLNWFSKTSIIKWHAVRRWKLVAALVIWGLSLALYGWSFELGARWLFLLSMAHVLLEFPLNHVSFVGIGQELAARLRPRAARG